MSIRDEKLDANRQNAEHSTGPRSPEGKRRSRFNATRHNLSSQVIRCKRSWPSRTTNVERSLPGVCQ